MAPVNSPQGWLLRGRQLLAWHFTPANVVTTASHPTALIPPDLTNSVLLRVLPWSLTSRPQPSPSWGQGAEALKVHPARLPLVQSAK